MATALDWEDRFCEFVRVSPGDGRGIWTLIAECLDDDAALTHTFNAALRRHGVPHASWMEMRQDLALRLARCIRTCPHLNLHHRWQGVTAAAWFHCVIDKLCDSEVRAHRPKERRRQSLDELMGQGHSAPCDVDDGEAPHERVEHSVKEAGDCEMAADATQDLAQALRQCDPRTISVIMAFAKHRHVQTVADDLKLPYATAWRKVKLAQKLLRQLLPGYGDDHCRQTKRRSRP